MLVSLWQTMLQHGQRNIARALEDVIALLDDGVFEEASRAYRQLANTRSFTDFYIHDADFEEQKKLNAPLDAMRAKLWASFSS